MDCGVVGGGSIGIGRRAVQLNMSCIGSVDGTSSLPVFFNNLYVV